MSYKNRITSSYGAFDAPEFNGTLPLKLLRSAVKVSELVAPSYTRRKMESLLFRPRRKKNDPKDRFLTSASVMGDFALKSGVTCKYYIWGGEQPDVLLVHGWESKASHFSTLIESLTRRGLCVAAFDAVAHGQSGGIEADMLDFMECITHMVSLHGSIDCVIGYSFGGLAAVNAIKAGLPVKRLGLISSPSSFYGVFEKVSAQLRLTKTMQAHLSSVVLDRYRLQGDDWDFYSTYLGVEAQSIPLVVLHDANDTYVNKIESEVLVEVWPNAKLIETSGLGHRGIIRSAPALDRLCDALLAN
ncbi:alpha/beta hydrolase [Pseudomonas chlororaphis]|uniref:alpha/beta hydrolase n=1 Tax=Pseudomonas chlororaphis TaxID=587753 RepID=UPI0009B8E1B5|nr:alpha/beta hydrolase [Pseudomonas chlororaphis]